MEVAPALGEPVVLVVPDVVVVLVGEDAVVLGAAAEVDGTSSEVADDSGAPALAETRSGEGLADPVTAADAVVAGAAGLVVEAGWGAADSVESVRAWGLEVLAGVGAVGSCLVTRSLGEAPVATGVV